MDILFLFSGAILLLGLFIVAWDILKKSNSKVARLYLMPWTVQSIFIIFKTLQKQGQTLDKQTVVNKVVSTVYPRLVLPPIFKGIITETVFKDIVEIIYLFIEDKCRDFTVLLEDELSEYNPE